jgi:hypothetical protein
MKLNLGVRLAVAAALFGAVPLAASANTVVVTPPVDLTGNPAGNTTTGSGLFVEAFDPILNKGFVEYLGPNASQFTTGAVTPGTTFDFGTINGAGTNTWANVFAASVAAGNPIDFVVMASNQGTTGANYYELTGPSTGLGTTRNSTIAAAAGNITSALAALPVVPGSGNPIVGLAAGDSGTTFFGAIGNTIGGIFTTPQANGVAGGGAIDFWQATQVAGLPTKLITPVKYTGGGQDATWTLSSAGDLQFNVPAGAVPLPAAVWLFGSGLLGLIGVGRRRVQQA